MFDRLQNTLRENCPIRSFSAPYFPALGLNTDSFYAVTSISWYSVRIRENTDQENSEYIHFLRSNTQRKSLLWFTEIGLWSK